LPQQWYWLKVFEFRRFVARELSKSMAALIGIIPNGRTNLLIGTVDISSFTPAPRSMIRVTSANQLLYCLRCRGDTMFTRDCFSWDSDLHERSSS
jgi:hypothetical protein